MNPDLVHPARLGPAEHHAGPAVEAEPLELGVAVLAVRTDLTDPDLVADDLNRLLAADRVSEKNRNKALNASRLSKHNTMA